MRYVVGEPPKWLIQAQRNDKYLFRIALVGQYLWAEIACWKTAKGGNGSWVLQRNRIKAVTPWISIAVGIWIAAPSASGH